jgi:hypothetical protein
MKRAISLMGRNLRRLVVAFTAGMLSVVAPLAAGADGGFEIQDWSSDATVKVDTVMPPPLNSFTANTEITAAPGVWNAVSGSWFDFVVATGFNMSGSIAINNVPNGSVYITDFFGSVASASACTDGSMSTPCLIGFEETRYSGAAIVASLVQLNENDNIPDHISSSSTTSTGKIDLRSAVIHELGHSHGMFHYTSQLTPGNCATGGSAQTMCSHFETNISVAYYRSLESAERTDFANNY